MNPLVMSCKYVILTSRHDVVYIIQVKDSLDQIGVMYERFHRDQISVVQTYPHMVREEIEDFDLAIRSYFSVDREMPDNQQV